MVGWLGGCGCVGNSHACTYTHVSQLLRVEPSTQVRGPPAIRWQQARRDGLGATRGV